MNFQNKLNNWAIINYLKAIHWFMEMNINGVVGIIVNVKKNMVLTFLKHNHLCQLN